MPLIHKRRIWWEPVSGAKEYVVYVSLDEKPIDPSAFSWEETTSMISKLVVDKTELIIPDEWPEFPAQSGTYHLAVTARNDVGNQSDPLFLSGVFDFMAPGRPARGGIESLSNAQPPEHHEQESPHPPQEPAFDRQDLQEVNDDKERGDTYLSQKVYPMGIHLRNSDPQG